MKAASILDTIGGTPHVRVSRLFPDREVWIKSERSNPGGSIKDRIGLAMIEDAERSGALKPGGTTRTGRPESNNAVSKTLSGIFGSEPGCGSTMRS